MKINPQYLTHPNIPKPLHGVNPRSIKGQQWWDLERQKAYAKNDYHCWACGVHKSQAKYHQWLEAHEAYDINYRTGQVKLIEIIALCHMCHNFIHSGRLYMLYKKGEISQDKAIDILQHGFDILEANGLEPFSGTQYVAYLIAGYADHGYEFIEREQGTVIANWSDWHLVIDGKKHYSPYKNIDEWKRKYGVK